MSYLFDTFFYDNALIDSPISPFYYLVNDDFLPSVWRWFLIGTCLSILVFNPIKQKLGRTASNAEVGASILFGGGVFTLFHGIMISFIGFVYDISLYEVVVLLGDGSVRDGYFSFFLLYALNFIPHLILMAIYGCLILRREGFSFEKNPKNIYLYCALVVVILSLAPVLYGAYT